MDFFNIKESNKGAAAVIGGFLIHLTLGNLYSFGNMMTYMDSYMHVRVDERVTVSNFIWVNSVIMAAQGFFMVLGGILGTKIGVRWTCLLGCILLSSGIGLTYFSIQTSFSAVIFTYGFLSGLGISFSYVLPLSCGMKWFPERKGLVSGVIVGGFGLGSLGSTTLQTQFLNPENIPVASSGYFEAASVLDRVPNVFLLLAGIFFSLQLLGCCLLSIPKTKTTSASQVETEHLLEDEGLQETAQELTADAPAELSTSIPGERHSRPAERDLSLKEALQTRTFWILWAIYFCNTVAVGYANAMYKSFGQTFIKSDFFLSRVGSLASIFNFGGRIAWGTLMDKTSFRFSMTLMTACLAASYLTLSLTPLMGKFAFAVWIWWIFFSFSGTFVLVSTGTEKAFGQANYPSIYGVIFTNQVLSGVILSCINETVLHRFGYSGCFVTVALFVLGGTVLTRILPKPL